MGVKNVAGLFQNFYNSQNVMIIGIKEVNMTRIGYICKYWKTFLMQSYSPFIRDIGFLFVLFKSSSFKFRIAFLF